MRKPITENKEHEKDFSVKYKEKKRRPSINEGRVSVLLMAIRWNCDRDPSVPPSPPREYRSRSTAILPNQRWTSTAIGLREAENGSEEKLEGGDERVYHKMHDVMKPKRRQL